MITCNNKLTTTQLHQLEQLKTQCLLTDSGLPNFYTTILACQRAVDGNFLYYIDDQLVGFLAVYFFYADACEVSLIVSPGARKQQIASQLLNAMHPLMVAQGIFKIIFSMSGHAPIHWLMTKGLKYHSSEYHLERQGGQPVVLKGPSVDILPAGIQNVLDLLAIDQLCFVHDQIPSSVHLLSLLNDSRYTLIVACFKQQVVGKAHIRWDDNKASFSDIAVLPSFQRQGVGSQLVSYCINTALNKGYTCMQLDVEAKNQHALGLYIKLGFEITAEQTYWIWDLKEHSIGLKPAYTTT